MENIERPIEERLAHEDMVVFSIATGDAQIAKDIERALIACKEAVGLSSVSKPAVFLLSGWIERQKKEDFERLRVLGAALESLDDFSLWLLSAESSVEDIERFAPEQLYITGRLMAADIPVFAPENGLNATYGHSISRETKQRWIGALKRISPGPTTLSAWRHDIRGRILAVVRNYLQADPETLEEFARAEDTLSMIAFWRQIVQARPYCHQQPGVVEAAIRLLDGLEEYRIVGPDGVSRLKSQLQSDAESLMRALDEARER
ncbi:MAG: hypothetical protein IT367_20375 [Candidatus Hydrogenedentes bacterium]|nr:hypothetical protein [Candidatus Hydrogenedentota bacterium]